MRRILMSMCFIAVLTQTSAAADLLEYTADNHLILPAYYRAWAFLTSSLDLNYDRPGPGAATTPSVFNNVFVNPSAYATFVKTGQWPDGTVLVTENRLAATGGTLSKAGKYQTGIVGMEFHIKDARRFRGAWAFYVSDGKTPARYLNPSMDCYSCHAQHGAVDTTFVQFYPTLLRIATAKHTLAPTYLKEQATLAGKH